ASNGLSVVTGYFCSVSQTGVSGDRINLLVRSIGFIDRTWVHPEYLPNVTIQVFKTPAIHKLVLHWFSRFLCAGRKRFQEHFIDFSLTVGRQCHQHLSGFCGIGDFLPRERLKEWL